MIVTRRAAAIAVLSPAVIMAACRGGGDGLDLQSEHRTVTEVNNSGFSGEAVLLSGGDNRTQVTVAIGSGEGLAGDFPVVIQRGGCSGLSGDLVHDLGNLQSGFLSTTVPAPMEELTSEHALVVFESPGRSIYVACGELD
jgi:hypothetical protein